MTSKTSPDTFDRIVRKATSADLESIMSILISVGNKTKEPNQGFLMDDYTNNQDFHRKMFAEELKTTAYTYVCEENNRVVAFTKAYTREEWLQKVPNWESEVFWKPGFNRDYLVNYVLINQTAMFPELTSKGLGSLLFNFLIQELIANNIKNIFAETVIAPIPNLASLNYRLKQRYEFAGMRYEEFKGQLFTTLIYSKETKEVSIK